MPSTTHLPTPASPKPSIHLEEVERPKLFPHQVGWDSCSLTDATRAAQWAMRMNAQTNLDVTRIESKVLHGMRADLRAYVIRTAAEGVSRYSESVRHSTDQEHPERGSFTDAGSLIRQSMKDFFKVFSTLGRIEDQLCKRGESEELYGKPSDLNKSGSSEDFHVRYSKVFGEIAPKESDPRSKRDLSQMRGAPPEMLKVGVERIVDLLTAYHRENTSIFWRNSNGSTALLCYYLGCAAQAYLDQKNFSRHD